MEHEDPLGAPADGWHKVSDPRAARMLSDSRSLEFFSPFLARTSSVSQAAQELGCDLSTMYYRVRSFVQAGLIEVVREEKRAGRPVKYYRSVADGFVVPFDVSPYAELEERLEVQSRELQREVAENLARLLRDLGAEARRIFRGRDGQVWSQGATDLAQPIDLDDPNLPVTIDFSKHVRLSLDEARQLQEELRQLSQRYEGPDRPGREYIVQATLVPIVKRD